MAKAMLKDTSIPVKTIAARMGFFAATLYRYIAVIVPEGEMERAYREAGIVD